MVLTHTFYRIYGYDCDYGAFSTTCTIYLEDNERYLKFPITLICSNDVCHFCDIFGVKEPLYNIFNDPRNNDATYEYCTLDNNYKKCLGVELFEFSYEMDIMETSKPTPKYRFNNDIYLVMTYSGCEGTFCTNAEFLVVYKGYLKHTGLIESYGSGYKFIDNAIREMLSYELFKPIKQAVK